MTGAASGPGAVPRRRLRVLMAGPDPRGKGGMETAAGLFLRHADADVHYVSTYRAGSAMQRIALWLRAWSRVGVELVRGRPDVVHVHLSERISLVREGGIIAMARLRNVPTVLHCHGAEFEASFSGLPGTARRIVRWMLAGSSAFLVLGDRWRATYAQALDVPQSRFAMLYNPVALPPPARVPDRAAGSSDSLRVLFLGRLGRRKGTYDVVEAVAALPEPIGRRTRLRIGGDGDDEALREFCRSKSGDDSPVLGWLGPEQKEAELAAADVFVLPSHDEGLPMALLEAMAWGLVPVVSAAGSMAEVVVHGENGLIVAPGEIADITEALERVLGDDELRATLSKAARETVQRFSVDRYMADVLQVWHGLVRA